MFVKYCVLVLSLLFFYGCLSAEGKKELVVKGPLETLAKKPGAHIKKIEAMGDHSWLNLGKPVADPKWGVARGRAWAPKMTFAENVNVAFFVGTGRHGYMKPNGHFMDDLWAYDVNGNKWICLYPGTSKKTKLKLDEHGFEVTLDGIANPVSFCSHAYNNLTYLPDTGRFMLTYRCSPWWTKALPQRGEWLGIPKDKLKAYAVGKLNNNARHPIYYNVTKGTWERSYVENKKVMRKGGMSSSFMGVLEYIPSKKKIFYLYGGKVVYFDPAKNEWSNVSPSSKHKITYDMNGCLDTKRNRMLIFKGNGFWAYNLEKDSWETPKSENQPKYLPTCVKGSTFYDKTNDAVIVFYKIKNIYKLHIYICESGKWEEKEIKFPDNFRSAYKLIHGFYHPGLNACFYYMAGDSDNKQARMLVYRYKK
ncbi:MAG: hypothetical protein COA79_15580 [Planctomycetota bacterium]|nr:MAG: hypothetical protein COA79_15580 [Planctomycetota bacterium]